ncbi:MAG: DUF3461 family protein [Arenicellales bacterium WSBS_2016_MAG_OTU3]
MTKFSTLAAMGIQNPEEIARFSLYMTENTDILRIVYNRKKGSILPVSHRYRFPQLKKSTLVDSGTRQTEIVYESSAEFRNALADLNQLMDKKKDKQDTHELLNEEVRLLEEEVALRIAAIKSLLAKI